MRADRSSRRFLYALLIAAGALAQAAPPVLADDVTPPGYPPGWNVRKPVGPILYEFRSGCWNDFKRYWPDEAVCINGAVPSRQLPDSTAVYQFKTGGSGYEPMR